MDSQLYLENKKHNQTEIAEGKIVLESKMRRLMVVLTGCCNINCIMCQRQDSSFTLPKAKVQQITEFFPYLDSIMWQGGEVFLVDYFKELFQEASRYPDLLQEVNTNGLLITEDWADIIARANARLIISVDSTDKHTYEYIRRGAKFETLIRNLSLFKEARRRHSKNKPADIINVVVMRANYQGLEAFVDFALEYGFSGINFMYMVGQNCPQENIFDPLDRGAVEFLKKHIPEITAKALTFNLNVSCEFNKYLSKDNAGPAQGPASGFGKNLFCSMPWRSLFIDGAKGGKVYPECVCLQPVGDIANNTLDEIWNNSAMQLYRKRIAG